MSFYKGPIEPVYPREAVAGVLAHYELVSPDPLIIHRAIRRNGAVVDFGFEFCNPAAAELFGRTAWELRDASLLRSFPHLAHEATGFARYVLVLDTGETEDAEVPHPLGKPHWTLQRRLTSLFDDRLAVSYRDTRDEVRAREQLQLSVDAVQHRLRRQLALVQAICNHSLEVSASLGDFRYYFPGRIAALAEVECLIQEAGDRIRLAELVERVLAPFRRCKRSLDGDGNTAIPASAVLPLAIALHELGSTSLTQGSWAEPHGKVELQWHSTDRALRLEWSERKRDGSPAARRPDGSGLVLVENAITSLINGRFEVRRDAGRIRHLMEFDPVG